MKGGWNFYFPYLLQFDSKCQTVFEIFIKQIAGKIDVPFVTANEKYLDLICGEVEQAIG
jgi:hypothetical protein